MPQTVVAQPPWPALVQMAKEEKKAARKEVQRGFHKDMQRLSVGQELASPDIRLLAAKK